jgi:hypothetical protein
MSALRLPMAAALAALRERFSRGPKYRTALLAATEGRIPAERSAAGHWSIAECDLDAIGRYFKLEAKEE